MRLSLVLILAFVVFAVKADMTREQKRRCELFASIFENGKFELQYDYVENIHDNKGYTSGRIAFTTSMGDAFEVVRRYTVRVPNNPLARFVSDLKLLADRESHDVSQLTEYPKAWRLAARDPVFRMIQDEVADSLYYRPAMILANKDNVQTGLGKCIFYDTVIQHGNGDDLDSISAIIRRTEQIEGGIVDANEAQWVQVFLKTRRHVLIHPRNKENRNQIKWKESVERVDILLELAEMANWDLNGPIHIDTPYHKATIL